MKINLNYLSTQTFSILKESAFDSLTERQKKVMAVALIVFLVLAACYFLMRRCCPDTLPFFNPQPPDNKAKSLALVGKAIDLAHQEEKALLEALEKDPKSYLAKWHLANHLQFGESVTLLDGTTVTKADLYKKIIEQFPNATLSYSSYEALAATLKPNETVYLLGKNMTQQDLLDAANNLVKSKAPI